MFYIVFYLFDFCIRLIFINVFFFVSSCFVLRENVLRLNVCVKLFCYVFKIIIEVYYFKSFKFCVNSVYVI